MASMLAVRPLKDNRRFPSVDSCTLPGDLATSHQHSRLLAGVRNSAGAVPSPMEFVASRSRLNPRIVSNLLVPPPRSIRTPEQLGGQVLLGTDSCQRCRPEPSLDPRFASCNCASSISNENLKFTG
eukprot:3254503-Amphidinium_carterae.2